MYEECSTLVYILKLWKNNLFQQYYNNSDIICADEKFPFISEQIFSDNFSKTFLGKKK